MALNDFLDLFTCNYTPPGEKELQDKFEEIDNNPELDGVQALVKKRMAYIKANPNSLLAKVSRLWKKSRKPGEYKY